MLRVFFGRWTLGNVRSSKKTISKVPWASMSQNEYQLKRASSSILQEWPISNFQLLCRDSCAGKHNVIALWNYVCFGGYQEHGRAEIVQSLYGDQGPLRLGNLMSNFTRCSHPFLLIHINSFISQRNRRHPQPIIPHPKNVLPTPCDTPHLTLSLSRPILVHSSIHLPRCPSSAKSKPTPGPSTIASSPLNAETKTAAALVSDASITIVNLRQCHARTMDIIG